MNIHHQQPFYQEDFSSSYNNNCYYELPTNNPPCPPSYQNNFNAINANTNINCLSVPIANTSNVILPSPPLEIPLNIEDPIYSSSSSHHHQHHHHHLQTPNSNNNNNYWTPEEDDKSLCSSSSSVVDSLNGGSYGGCYSSSGSPDNNNFSGNVPKVRPNVKSSKGGGPGPHPQAQSKRKGVGGRRKSEKPPSPTVMKKRRLAANARWVPRLLNPTTFSIMVKSSYANEGNKAKVEVHTTDFY